jgi:hypothetical protein
LEHVDWKMHRLLPVGDLARDLLDEPVLLGRKLSQFFVRPGRCKFE